MTIWRTSAWATILTGALLAGALLAGTPALAADGMASPWQLSFQTPATPVMEEIVSFHHMLLWLISIITIFVTGLMVYCFIRFNARANPTPSKTTHNTLIEVLWTVIPIIILVVIAIPSFKLLYFGDRAADADMTIKAIGHQWYWSYEYPDNGDFTFDSVMKEDADLKPGEPRLLTPDTMVVVPVNATVRVLVTADDVIHSWAVPAFGVKMDGVPGRINETWFRAEREGTYYGQCSELCGANHGFMPIKVHVVSKAAFDEWVVKAKEEYARADDGVRIADNHTVAAQ